MIKEHLELMIVCDLWFEEQGEKVQNYIFHHPLESDLELLKSKIEPDKEYRAVVEFRKYLFQYIKGVPNAREWKQRVIPIKTFGGIIGALEELRAQSI